MTATDDHQAQVLLSNTIVAELLVEELAHEIVAAAKEGRGNDSATFEKYGKLKAEAAESRRAYEVHRETAVVFTREEEKSSKDNLDKLLELERIKSERDEARIAYCTLWCQEFGAAGDEIFAAARKWGRTVALELFTENVIVERLRSGYVDGLCLESEIRDELAALRRRFEAEFGVASE